MTGNRCPSYGFDLSSWSWISIEIMFDDKDCSWPGPQTKFKAIATISGIIILMLKHYNKYYNNNNKKRGHSRPSLTMTLHRSRFLLLDLEGALERMRIGA